MLAASGLDSTVDEVRSALSGSAEQNTVLLTVQVLESSPERAQALATGVVKEFGSFVATLDEGGATTTEPRAQLNVVSGPTQEAALPATNPTLNILLGVLLGLAAGLALAQLRERMDTSIRTVETLREVTGLPVLGATAMDAQIKSVPVLTSETLRSVAAEAFRQIRTNLQFADVDKHLQVIVVTSAVADSGKSTIAANLAVVYAEAGHQVLLIDADMRHPRLAEYLGLEGAVGLSTVLAGRVQLADATQEWGADELTVLLIGTAPPNPTELLGSPTMTGAMAELRRAFDIIIVDTPPVLPVADAAVCSTWADGVVLVVRHGRTSSSQVSTALQSLRAVEAHVAGCVLSMRPRRGAESSGYDAYGYRDDETGAQHRS